MKRSLSLIDRHRPVLATTQAVEQRPGFTLIELMIAITIIAMLAGLLVVAVQGARTAAFGAAVKTEINDLSAAIDSFHAKYNAYPPSAIILSEDPTAWTATQLAELQRIWPQFSPLSIDTDADGTPGESGDDGIDFNGDGDITDIIELDGSECLAFFLGGVMATDVMAPSSTAQNGTPTGSAGPPITWGPLGFGKNPVNPFTRSTAARVGPFFEFDAARLKDTRDGTVASSTGADSMPSYLDGNPDQTTPYAYFRSTPIGGYSYPAGISPMCPVDNDTSTLASAYLDAAGLAHNAKTYQLISPGLDGIFGLGGTYTSEDGVGGEANRRAETDNISNFSGGVFGP